MIGLKEGDEVDELIAYWTEASERLWWREWKNKVTLNETYVN